MTGAECLLRTLAANGVELCFMNPGTSEMHFVSALDRVREVRGVLGLFEGVCAGAADGYARMTGKPAATLLHLGPGLANGLSNLHNARKARSPVVNIVGEHSTQHLRYDAPLSADIEAFARTVSGYVRVVKDASEVGVAVAETIAGGRDAAGPGGDADRAGRPVLVGIVERCPGGGSYAGVVCLQPIGSATPSDCCGRTGRRCCSAGRPRQTAHSLPRGGSLRRPVCACSRIATRPRHSSGRGRFQPQIIPYFPEMALPLLADVRNLILVETQPPVSFFGYPNTPSYLLPEESGVFVLAGREEDGAAALEALADACGAGPAPAPTIQPAAYRRPAQDRSR